jgi:hypothetical protein
MVLEGPFRQGFAGPVLPLPPNARFFTEQPLTLAELVDTWVSEYVQSAK